MTDSAKYEIPNLDKYSLIEISVSGGNLYAKEKVVIRDLFLSCRIPAKSLVISDYKNTFRTSCYTRSLAKVRQLRERYQNIKNKKISLTRKVLRKRDWFDKWKLDYHIQSFGSKFKVVPIWEKQKFKDPQRIPIFLEPGSAFGSGNHETTRLMVRLLEILAGRIQNFLDIGTGTGILSITASKLGANRIVGFDHDKPSAITAQKNFLENGCSHGAFFCANLKKLNLKERFHVVAANLLSKTLLECRSKILSCVRTKGYLLVSGITKENLADFRKRFETRSLQCLKILRGRRWTALLYRKA